VRNFCVYSSVLSLLLVALLFSGSLASSSLLGGLLLLLLVLLGGGLANGLLKDLQDLLVLNLLVRLDLLEVQSRGLSQTLDAVLGDS
jgi:hypothetical protein